MQCIQYDTAKLILLHPVNRDRKCGLLFGKNDKH